MSVLALDAAIRRYDWGSPTAIPKLLGVEPDGRPVAELWFGAHPDDPSPVPALGTTLDAILHADPAAVLGQDSVERFGPRLPFLLKILAASKPLSIQVHPGLAQARAGFAAEEAAGISRDDPRRNYRDANHKPELLCALTPFEAFCGFRPVAQTLGVLEQLDAPELGFVADLLRGPDPLRDAFTTLLRHPDPKPLIAALVGGLDRLGRHSITARFTERAVAAFPDDIGVVVTLLLNPVRLEPGEAIYLDAGNVHAYLHGMGVEIMADSDNVLRCGLTPKHVDVPEVLQVTRFAELAEPRWLARNGVFDVPVPDFRLVPIPLVDDVTLSGFEPWVVLCVEGDADVAGVRLTPGRAAFVPAGDEAVPINGSGRLYAAAAGLPVG